MPSVICTSKLKAKAGVSTLLLAEKHLLIIDSPSEIYRASKFPEKVDIHLAGRLNIQFVGYLDNKRVSPDAVRSSDLVNHVAAYLRANTAQLALSAVSDIYTGNDDLPTLTLTSARSRNSILPVRVELDSIQLHFKWLTNPNSDLDSQPLDGPFSSRLSLPFRSLLDNVLERFVSYHLVKRYPLIFGTWCQQLDVESRLFPKIFRSISNIIEHSPDPAFRRSCKRLFKLVRDHHKSSYSEAVTSLSDYLGSMLDDSIDETLTLTNEDAFSLSMENIYRNGQRKPKLKFLSSNIDEDDDDEELARDHSQSDIPDLPVQAQPEIAQPVMTLKSDDDTLSMDGSYLAWDSPTATPENSAVASPQNIFGLLKYALDCSVQDSGDLDPFDMDLVIHSDLESTQNNSVALYDLMEDEELFICASPLTDKSYPFGCERPIAQIPLMGRDGFDDDVLDMCSDADDCVAGADQDMLVGVEAPSNEVELDWDEDDRCFLEVD